jgi:succinate dehydrogenase / fumarate reductase iron-sulfur subunit
VESRYDTFTLDADPTDNVLGILIKINHDLDPTLSFRFACGVIKCGECGIAVNGIPCLACEKVVEEEMRIDPLPALPVIKDLVVDRKEVFRRIASAFPPLNGTTEGGSAITPERIDDFVRLTKCFECCICQSSCPVYAQEGEAFVGPLGLLWFAQNRLRGPHGTIPGQHVERMLDMCLRCGVCSQACPCSDDILDLAIDVLEKR